MPIDPLMTKKAPEDFGRDYDIKVWRPLYTKIMILVQKGETASQIANRSEIGLEKRQLSRIINAPTFRLKMAKLVEKFDVALIEKATEEISKTPEVDLAKIKLAGAAEEAANLLLRLMNPRSSLQKRYSIHERRLMASIAQDVLDRAGLKVTVSVEEGARSREYSPEEIKSALSNAKELEQISQRLEGRDSSYVLTREERIGAEPTDALDPTVATEPEGVPVETNAVEQPVANPDPNETPIATEQTE
jgi:hypothetical protein